MQQSVEHPDVRTSCARNRANERIHIKDIPKGGRNGYSCPGCAQEVVAIKGAERRPYFRHHATEQSPRKKCTYSDQDERYKIAKESLQRLKKIKVPVVHKLAPPGQDGPPMKISDPRFIEAYKIEIEQFFYKDEKENIHWGHETDDHNLTLLLKAHAVLLDQSENPILLIQFVEKHTPSSLTTEEKVGLRHIGVDAVQIRIPTESAEAIEKAFLSTTSTKWIFNNQYEKTSYSRPTGSIGGEIYSIDELQGQFLEENFNCRRAEITRIIRQITIYRQSKAFTDARERLQSEISRLEEAARRIRREEEKFEVETLADIQREFVEEEREIERRREAVARKETRIARINVKVS
jgi:hypothetical protein